MKVVVAVIAMMVTAAMFVLIAVIEIVERLAPLLIVGLGCAVCLQGALAIKHKVFLHLERATGTLDHANSLSMYLCMTAPIFVAALNSSFPKLIRYFATMVIGFVLMVGSFVPPATVIYLNHSFSRDCQGTLHYDRTSPEAQSIIDKRNADCSNVGYTGYVR